MAFVPGYNSRYYVGSMRFSVYGRELSAQVTANQLDVTTQEDRAKLYQYGHKDGSASISMLLDTAYAAQSQFAILNSWTGSSQVCTFGFDGLSLADEAWLINGNQSSVTFDSPVGDVHGCTVQIQPDGPIDWGYVIDAETAITVDTNGAAYNSGASSTNGGVAHLHVTAFSGLTNNVITIEHSTNGSTGWATVGTFATVTGVTSERLVIAPGTTVNQYLRVVDNVTGTGSNTRIVTFARR